MSVRIVHESGATIELTTARELADMLNPKWTESGLYTTALSRLLKLVNLEPGVDVVTREIDGAVIFYLDPGIEKMKAMYAATKQKRGGSTTKGDS